MLTDKEFVIQAITTNVFYLLNVRAYSLNITLSFLDRELINQAKTFVEKSEEILNLFISEAVGFVPKLAIKNKFIVTEYTMECNDLTNKLFNINLDTTIIKELSKLDKTLNDKEITSELVDLMMIVSKKTCDFLNQFVEFLRNIFELKKNQQIFSYSYPFLLREVMEIMTLFEEVLERVIKKMPVSPTFISKYEYRILRIMENVSLFLSRMVDPSREDIYITLNSYSKEFNVIKNYFFKEHLNPNKQKTLNLKSKKLFERYSKYLGYCIKELLNKKAYFIVEPMFIDDFYRGANYSLYNILLTEESAKEY